MAAPTIEIGLHSTGTWNQCSLTDNTAARFSAAQVLYGARIEMGGSFHLPRLCLSSGSVIIGPESPKIAALSADVNDSAAPIPITDTIDWPSGNPIAYALIGNEVVSYTSIADGAFQGVTRGVFGTAAVAHAAGAAVEQLVNNHASSSSAYVVHPHQINNHQVRCDYRVLTSETEINSVGVEVSQNGGGTYSAPLQIDAVDLTIAPSIPNWILGVRKNTRCHCLWSFRRDGFLVPQSDITMQVKATDGRCIKFQILVPTYVTPGAGFQLKVRANYDSGELATGYASACTISTNAAGGGGTLSVTNIQSGDWAGGIATFNGVTWTQGANTWCKVTVTDDSDPLSTGNKTFYKTANAPTQISPADFSLVIPDATDIRNGWDNYAWTQAFAASHGRSIDRIATPATDVLRVTGIMEQTGGNASCRIVNTAVAFNTANNVSARPQLGVLVWGQNSGLGYDYCEGNGIPNPRWNFRLRFVYDKNYYDGKPMSIGQFRSLPTALVMTYEEWVQFWSYYDGASNWYYLPLAIDMSTPAPNGYVLIGMMHEWDTNGPLPFDEAKTYSYPTLRLGIYFCVLAL